jgi:hypothetical protein
MSDGLPDALKGLLQLASQTRDQYQEAAGVHQTLSQLDAAQKILINSLAETIPDYDEIQKKLEEADSEIASLDARLSQTQDKLLEALTAQPSQQVGPSDILKNILVNFQSILLKISKDYAGRGQTGVPVLAILQFADQIAKTIDDMTRRGLYPEEPDEEQARIQKRQQHASKMIALLEAMKTQQGSGDPSTE